MEKINPRRRVLLIAIASWAVVGLRAKSANPFTGAVGLLRLVLNIVRAPLKIFGVVVKKSLSLAIPWKRR